MKMDRTRADPDPTPAGRRSPLVRNMAWLTGGEAIGRLIAFAVAVYLARALGVAGYGAIGVAFAFVAYLAILVQAGLDAIGTREAARHPEAAASVWRDIVSLRLILASSTYGLLALLSFWLPEPAIGGRALALVYGGRLFCLAVNSAWLLRARDKMGLIAAGVILQHVLYALGIFWLVRGPSPELVTVAIVQVASEFALSVWLYLCVRRGDGQASSAGGRGRLAMLGESWPVGAAKALRLVYYQGDLLLLAWLSTAEQAGYFLVSQRVILSMTTLSILYYQNAFPTLSRLTASELSKGIRFRMTTSRFALSVIVPLAVAGGLCSRVFITVLFGREFDASAPIFSTMLLGLPIIVMSAGLRNQLLADGHSVYLVRSEAIAAVTHVALAALLVPGWGGWGAACSSVSGECLAFAYLAFVVRAKHQVPPLDGRSIRVFSAGALMALSVYLLSEWGALAAVVLGTVVYATALLALGGVTIRELQRLFQSVRRSPDLGCGA